MSLQRPTPADPYTMLPTVGEFAVTSTDLADGGPIPVDHAYSDAGGRNISPALSWSGAPEQTASYVVTCFDPDAPTPSGFWHWAVVGIPGGATELPTGAGADDTALAAALGADTMFHLRNDFSRPGYDGCAPPPGDVPHRYYFAVHAVDVPDLGLDADCTPAKLSFVLAFHTLARAVMHGTFTLPDGQTQ